MRLIDADELLTRIRLNYNNHQNVSANSIKDIIDTTKTAYNVDAVVEELRKQAEQYRQRGFEAETKGYYAMAEYYGKYCSYEHATEIVRKGGVIHE